MNRSNFGMRWLASFAILTLLLASVANGQVARKHLPPPAIGPPAVTWDELVFESLGQGAPVGPGPKAPTVYMALNVNDLSVFRKFLLPEHERAAAGVNFSSHVVLGVFAGSVGSSGHAITVQQVALVARELRVVVTLRKPGPNEYVLPAFTSPYHLVQVPRTAFGHSIPLSWVLTDNQDRILGTGSIEQR